MFDLSLMKKCTQIEEKLEDAENTVESKLTLARNASNNAFFNDLLRFALFL